MDEVNDKDVVVGEKDIQPVVNLEDNNLVNNNIPAEEEDGKAPEESIIQQLLGTSYASPLPPFVFWVECTCIAIQSILLSFFSLGYLNVVYEVPKIWMSIGSDDYPTDPSTTTFLSGQPIWIAIGCITGLIVGILKAYIFKFEEYEGFLEYLMNLGEDGNPLDCLKVTITCLISLMGNASVGPESGLGAACAGMSIIYAKGVNSICRRIESWTVSGSSGCEDEVNEEKDEEVGTTNETNTNKQEKLEDNEKIRSKLIVLSGMTAAFSTILPTPVTAILLCIELPGFETLSSKHGLSYMKTLAQLTISGTLSFWIFDRWYGNTYLPTVPNIPGFVPRFESYDTPLAAGIGLMGSVLALSYLLIAGIVKACTSKAKSILDEKLNSKLRIVIISTIGGTLFGTLGYIFPLTLGDGSYQLGTIFGTAGSNISTSVLIASSFAKMLTYWISEETGMVGGLFYPMLLIGSMCGRVIVNEFGTSWATTLACSLVALPAAICPGPLTLMMLGISTFNLSSRGGIPVLVCTVTAHVLFVGLGIPQKLMSKAPKKTQ